VTITTMIAYVGSFFTWTTLCVACSGLWTGSTTSEWNNIVVNIFQIFWFLADSRSTLGSTITCLAASWPRAPGTPFTF